MRHDSDDPPDQFYYVNSETNEWQWEHPLLEEAQRVQEENEDYANRDSDTLPDGDYTYGEHKRRYSNRHDAYFYEDTEGELVMWEKETYQRETPWDEGEEKLDLDRGQNQYGYALTLNSKTD